MSNLDISLHPAQRIIFEDKHKVVVVAAGRRFGKTKLAQAELVVDGLQCDVPGADGLYVAPTFQQAKDLMWIPLKEMLAGTGTEFYENTGTATLPNGRRILLRGSDRPDTMRGLKLYRAVEDEVADMKANVHEEIILPATADLDAPILQIGTPKGRNHFYKSYLSGLPGGSPYTKSYHFTTYDNPFIDRAVIDRMKSEMSSFAFRQEFMASFEAASSGTFEEQWIIESEYEPEEGTWLISVDLAGFANDFTKQMAAKNPWLDSSAIAIVKVNGRKWWVKDIVYGRWTIRETATKILQAARSVRGQVVGIEKGILKQAVDSYLNEEMRRLGVYPRIEELTHNNQAKTTRIMWALQGRMEHKQITFNPGAYLAEFRDQLLQFPDPKSHDDLPDALAYIDQLSTMAGESGMVEEDDPWTPLDKRTGY